MSIAVTHVAAEHHPDGTAWTISLREYINSGEPCAVTVDDVPKRVREALAEWAHGDGTKADRSEHQKRVDYILEKVAAAVETARDGKLYLDVDGLLKLTLQQ